MDLLITHVEDIEHLKEVLDRLQSVFTIGGGVIKPQVDKVQSH